MKRQMELFIENYPNPEEVHPENLRLMAEEYAKYQANKEMKHYNAFLSGRRFYAYRGVRFPVLTEAFMQQTVSAKDIINDRQGKSRASTADDQSTIVGTTETIRSDSSDSEG